MARYLLDTDAVIDYLAGVPASVAFVRRLHEGGDDLCVCEVVLAEVHSGLKPQDRESAKAFLDALTFLPGSPGIGEQAGMWRYAYARKGAALATTDMLVAATAHAHQARVVTANLRDYPMPEVSIVPLPRVAQRS